MPFNKETAGKAGTKGGASRSAHWKEQDPSTFRTKQLGVKVTLEEFDAITEKAAALGISRTELVVRAVDAYKPTKASAIPKKETTEEIELVGGERIMYYPYIDPPPRPTGGGQAIGEDMNGGQIFLYDGKALVEMIEPVSRG